LQAIWDAEWQANLLQAALDRVKRRVQPAHYEMYYLHVVKEQPARDVARTLGVNAAQVYLAKLRVGRRLKKELERLGRNTS
jgi:RNA polymerase sigma-70 factor (ECF subfamily)